MIQGNENALNRSEYGNVNRFPVVEDDWTNPGCLYKLLLNHILTHDKHTPLYLFKYTPGQIERHQRKFFFNINLPMGVNTVASLFPALCEEAGVVGRKTPHMMRAFVATRLANDPTVSSAEVAAALRHTSLQSQQAYINPTVDSEISRAKALGGATAVADSKPAAKPAKRSKKNASVVPKKAKKAAPVAAPAMAVGPFAAAAPTMAAPFGFGFNPMAAAFMQQQAMMAPFGMMMPPQALPPHQGPTPASLAAAGLTQAQIDAVFAVEDSSTDEE